MRCIISSRQDLKNMLVNYLQMNLSFRLKEPKKANQKVDFYTKTIDLPNTKSNLLIHIKVKLII